MMQAETHSLSHTHANEDSQLHVAAAPSSSAAAPTALTLHDRLVEMSLRLRLRGGDLESATGLSGRELDLIALVSISGPTSVKSLVADLGLPRSTMTAIVDRLEERGLVVRLPNPNDRRSIILEATAHADEAFDRYRAGVARFVEHLSRTLTPEEQAKFGSLIEKLAGTL